MLEAAPRFELGIEDLQSTALPLGHTAAIYFGSTIYYSILRNNLCQKFKLELRYNIKRSE